MATRRQKATRGRPDWRNLSGGKISRSLFDEAEAFGREVVQSPQGRGLGQPAFGVVIGLLLQNLPHLEDHELVSAFHRLKAEPKAPMKLLRTRVSKADDFRIVETTARLKTLVDDDSKGLAVEILLRFALYRRKLRKPSTLAQSTQAQDRADYERRQQECPACQQRVS